MDIAAHVFATWTHRGARAAQLADRFLDGSIDQLAHFLTTEEPQQRVEPVEERDAGSTVVAPAQQAGQISDRPERILSIKHSFRDQPAASTAQHVTECEGCQRHCIDAAAVQSGAFTQPVDVRDAVELSYDEFVWRYMAANIPVVIRVSTVTAMGHAASHATLVVT